MLVVEIHVRMQAKKHKRKNIRIPMLGMNICIRTYIYIYIRTHAQTCGESMAMRNPTKSSHVAGP